MSSEAPGLLAAGGDLSEASLHRAYCGGAFPWFSEGQPILWWSPDPRMILESSDFRLHRSLRKTLEKFRSSPDCEIRFDNRFSDVIAGCAGSERAGQTGTWILPHMVRAYRAFHSAGFVHSVETWIDGRLVAGLYCVAIGRAVFGESMFTTVTDGSKIALAALLCFCRRHGIAWIDCQQNTRHLASFGAHEVERRLFLQQVKLSIAQPAPAWTFNNLYWNELLPSRPKPT